MENYDVQGKAGKKSRHCWTGFFSEKANLVPLQKQQRTVHYDTRMHRLGQGEPFKKEMDGMRQGEGGEGKTTIALELHSRNQLPASPLNPNSNAHTRE